jgi:hypothetical protein
LNLKAPFLLATTAPHVYHPIVKQLGPVPYRLGVCW